MRAVKNILPIKAVQDFLLGKDRLSKRLNDFCFTLITIWTDTKTRPVVLEDISPGLEENLSPEVVHGEVPVGVPDDVLQGPLAARQKSSENAHHPGLGRLTSNFDWILFGLMYFFLGNVKCKEGKS